MADVQTAPVLQQVAARAGGAPEGQRLQQPSRWAYALRDAVAVARPDWVVTHYDLALETHAAREQVEGIEDLPDVELASAPGGRAVLELTETLAGLYPGRVVAASITGPATMAVRLAAAMGETDADIETVALDCGDALAALAAALAESGAGRVIVWETEPGGLEHRALARAHDPILRRLGLAGVKAVIVGCEQLGEVGYAAGAWPGGGAGAALLGADAFTAVDALTAALEVATVAAGPGGVVLSDGPVPGDCDMVALRRLGERGAT